MKNHNDPFSKNSEIWIHHLLRKQKATLDLRPSYNIVMENSNLFERIDNEKPVTPPPSFENLVALAPPIKNPINHRSQSANCCHYIVGKINKHPELLIKHRPGRPKLNVLNAVVCRFFVLIMFQKKLSKTEIDQ